MDQNLEWKLVYTKARCESWSEANLRNQGFVTLMPRVRAGERDGGGRSFAPLFPRYLFVGHTPGRDLDTIPNTRGVLRLVYFGERPAKVPLEVIAEIRSRMDAHGIVRLEDDAAAQPLFDRRSQARMRALVKLAAAGFRVVAA